MSDLQTSDSERETQELSEGPPVGIIKDTLQTLDRYWFGVGSPTALGLFRIIICSLTVISLLMVFLDWDAWFSERGFVPAWLGARYIGSRIDVGFGTDWTLPRVGLINGVTDPRIALTFYLLTIAAGILTACGLWTRVSSILFALGMISLHHRNAAILHGGDSVMRLAAMYLAIAPSGAACSLDRLIGLWKGRISSAPVWVSMWPQRLISANVAVLYITTVWLKWEGNTWQDGTATYYPARLAEFFRFPEPSFINDFPMVYFTTYGTLFIEFALGTLVFFKPLRRYVLLLGVLLHIHIEYSMNIPLFSYLMVSTYLCFYDGDEVSDWAKRLGQRWQKFKVNIYLPSGLQLKPTASGFLSAVDPFEFVSFAVGSSGTWTATGFGNKPLSVEKALKTRGVGLWVFGWIPGVWDRILANVAEPIPLATDGEA